MTEHTATAGRSASSAAAPTGCSPASPGASRATSTSTRPSSASGSSCSRCSAARGSSSTGGRARHARTRAGGLVARGGAPPAARPPLAADRPRAARGRRRVLLSHASLLAARRRLGLAPDRGRGDPVLTRHGLRADRPPSRRSGGHDPRPADSTHRPPLLQGTFPIAIGSVVARPRHHGRDLRRRLPRARRSGGVGDQY